MLLGFDLIFFYNSLRTTKKKDFPQTSLGLPEENTALVMDCAFSGVAPGPSDGDLSVPKVPASEFGPK